MRIHKEGIIIILVFFLVISSFNLLIYWAVQNTWLQSLLIIASVAFLLDGGLVFPES